MQSKEQFVCMVVTVLLSYMLAGCLYQGCNVTLKCFYQAAIPPVQTPNSKGNLLHTFPKDGKSKFVNLIFIQFFQFC